MLCVHEGVVLCGVLRGVCGVLCWCWCLVVVVLCVVWVLCGGVVCIFVPFLCFSLFFLSVLFFLFLALASLLSSLLSSLPLCLLSSLLATAANFEAFECDLAHGKCTAVGSLPPPLSSLLLSLPPLLNSGEGIIFNYSFKLIQKNRRRVKLQTLQF